MGPYRKLLTLTTINLALIAVALLLDIIVAGWLWIYEIGARKRTP